MKKPVLYNNYRLLAIDGSNLMLLYTAQENNVMRNRNSLQRIYILGLSAFHSKKENSILQEIYARLIMYNFSMLITQHVKPKEKDLKYPQQINFAQAVKICLNFFKYRGKEPPYDIETTIQRFLLPIRPN